jgi:hypothetical protein
LLDLAQIACLMHGMKQGVHGARAERVPVTREFLDHAKAVDRAFRGVVQDMDTDEAEEELAKDCIGHR